MSYQTVSQKVVLELAHRFHELKLPLPDVEAWAHLENGKVLVVFEKSNYRYMDIVDGETTTTRDLAKEIVRKESL